MLWFRVSVFVFLCALFVLCCVVDLCFYLIWYGVVHVCCSVFWFCCVLFVYVFGIVVFVSVLFCIVFCVTLMRELCLSCVCCVV